MELTKVALVPQWSFLKGFVSTPDGGFLYIGPKSVSYIGNMKNGTPLIKVFQTRQSIFSIDIDPCWALNDGKNSERYFAALGQDNSIQIWDFYKCQAIRGHKGHIENIKCRYMEGNGPSPGATIQNEKVLMAYMRNRNVLSIDCHFLIVYCVASNSYCQKPMFISSRNHEITILSCSPYNENIFAVGTTRGQVLLCDLQKMSICYTLRGHDSSISGLSWNCIKYKSYSEQVKNENTENEHVNEISKTKQLQSQIAIATPSEDIFDIYDYVYLENEFGAPNELKTRNRNKSDGDENDEFVGIERPKNAANNFDFAEACQSLKEDIQALKDDIDNNVKQYDSVTLEDCKSIPRHISSSENDDDDLKDVNIDMKQLNKNDKTIDSNASTDGSSMEHIATSISSDELDVDGIDRKPKQQILLKHQFEVHAEQEIHKNMQPNVNENISNFNVKTESAMYDETSSNNEVEDILLVSVSVDGSITIWNTEHGGTCDHFKTNKKKATPITNVYWLNCSSFLITNRNGDLILYSLNENKNDSKDKPFTSLIRSYKFKSDNILYEKRNIMGFSAHPGTDLVWIVTTNRDIFVMNLKTKDIIAQYSTASTNISMFKESSDDMNKIAVAFSDRRVGIMDSLKLNSSNLFMENFNAKSIVSALAWSPDGKKLGFGNIDGGVGILNIESSSSIIYFNPICCKKIYTMVWEGKYIYANGNELIFVYDTESNSKDGYTIPHLPPVSTLSVRGNLLFIGTQRGALRLYLRSSSDFLKYDILQEVNLTNRYITEIAWNPIDRDKFAVVANSGKFEIFEFNKNSLTFNSYRVCEIMHTKATICCVKWSNRDENLFLTCGFDGALRVWNITADSVVMTFLKCFDFPLQSALFLPSNENIIIYAGRSISIQFIDMTQEKSDTQQQQQQQQQEKPKHKQMIENISWGHKVNRSETKTMTKSEKRRRLRKLNSLSKESNLNDVLIVSDDKENMDINNTAETFHIDDKPKHITLENEKINEIEIQLQDLSLKMEQKPSTNTYTRKPYTLLNATTREINKYPLESIKLILSSETRDCVQEDNKLFTAKLFGNRESLEILLNHELGLGENNDQRISNIYLRQMSASLKNEILKCIETKRLSAWHVSLAPTISYVFWQKCCQAFAEQLIEEDLILQAATYLIAIHKETESIKILISNNYYKEALVIAKVYLQQDDPLINDVIEKWINYLDTTGNLPGAALICVIIKDFNRSVEILQRIRKTSKEIEDVVELIKIKINE